MKQSYQEICFNLNRPKTPQFGHCRCRNNRWCSARYLFLRKFALSAERKVAETDFFECSILHRNPYVLQRYPEKIDKNALLVKICRTKSVQWNKRVATIIDLLTVRFYGSSQDSSGWSARDNQRWAELSERFDIFQSCSALIQRTWKISLLISTKSELSAFQNWNIQRWSALNSFF